jgi:hypothetical protein
MIVSFQKPVIQNEQTTQTNLLSKTSSIKADQFQNNNINFTSKLSKTVPLTERLSMQFREYITRFIFKGDHPENVIKLREAVDPTARKLFWRNTTGGNVFHDMLLKGDFKQVEKIINQTLDDPDLMLTLNKKYTWNTPAFKDNKTPFDIIVNRALTADSAQEKQQWEGLANKMLTNLEPHPKALNEVLTYSHYTLRNIISGGLNNLLDNVNRIMKDSPEDYGRMLRYPFNSNSRNYNENRDITAIHQAFMEGTEVLDKVLYVIVDKPKITDQVISTALETCPNLQCAVKINQFLNNHLSKKITNITDEAYKLKSMKDLTLISLKRDADNGNSEWNKLNKTDKQELIDTVEMLLDSKGILNMRSKVELITYFPEPTQKMKDKLENITSYQIYLMHADK